MSRPTKILAFSGSTRSGSWNTKLLRVVAESVRRAGAEVTIVGLRDFPMPVYDGDLEQESGIPGQAASLRALMLDHHGLLIACPEYNGSVTAVLKNALDWCSRPVDGRDGLAPYRGKAVAIVGASIGPFGGIRALGHLRAIMGKMGAFVLADDLAVPHAPQSFAEDGGLTNPAAQSMADQIGATLARTVAQMTAVAAGR